MFFHRSHRSRKSASRKHRRTHGQFTHQRKALFEQLEDRRLLAVYASSDVPQAIPDQGAVVSTLQVADSVTIGDLNVTLDISHTRDKDLDVFLVGPDGTRVQLMTDVGGNGNHFQGTVLDDEAASSITSGSAPFAGSYQPEGSLSSLDGKSAQGTWTLEVTDDQKRQTGTLNSWSIEVTPTQPPGPPTLSISDATIVEGGSLDTLVSSGSGGLSDPRGMTLGPDGNLYVASTGNASVLRYDGTSGAFIDAFVPAGSGGLDKPYEPVFGPDGNLYVISANTDEILRYNGTTGAFIDAFVTAGAGGLDIPIDLGFGPDGNLYVSTFTNGTVLRFNGTTGAFIDTFVTAGSGGILVPTRLLFHNDGRLYVSDFDDHSVLRYNGTTGAFIDVFVTSGSAGLDGPSGLVFGPDGNLYVSSRNTDNILRYDGSTGAFIDEVVAAVTGGLDRPNGLLFDIAGNLIVSSRYSDEVLRLQAGLTVSLSVPSAVPVTVDYSTADGTALAGADYTGITSGTLSFAPGQTMAKIFVSTIDDVLTESNETFVVNLVNPSGAYTISDGQGAATITDDDSLRQVSIGDVIVTEGDNSAHFRGAFVDSATGTNFNDLTFGPDGNLYTSPGPSPSQGPIDRYDGQTGAFLGSFVNDGRINGNRDIVFRDGFMYVGSENTDEVLRYNATTGAFVDTFVESGSGGIDGPHGLAFGPDTNGDSIPELYVTGRNSFDVIRYDGATGQPLGAFDTSGAGALSYPQGITIEPNGVAYVASTGSSKVQKFDTLNGTYLGSITSSQLVGPTAVRFGPDDGLMYVASSGNDRILRFDSNGNYIDDFVPAGSGGMDIPHRMEFGSDGNLYVTALGTNRILRFGTESEAVFTVSLSSPSSLPVSVDFDTEIAVGSATAGSDYTATSGTLTFAPGVTTQTILVSTTDDAAEESTESFFVNLSAATGAVIQDGQGEATIIDDDTTSSADPIYVYDIRFESKRGNKDWRAVFEIRTDSNANGLGDSGDLAVAGVQIEVTFAGQTYTGTTDANGVFRTSWIRNISNGSHYANAVDLALTDFTWNPLDLDLENDLDGDGKPDDVLTI